MDSILSFTAWIPWVKHMFGIKWLSSELSHHPSKVYFYKIENGSEKIGMLGLSAEISFWKTKMTSEDIYFPKLQRKFF